MNINTQTKQTTTEPQPAPETETLRPLDAVILELRDHKRKIEDLEERIDGLHVEMNAAAEHLRAAAAAMGE